MKPCPACGRTFFLTKASRKNHIEWENQEYRKLLFLKMPEFAVRLGIHPDGTVGEPKV